MGKACGKGFLKYVKACERLRDRPAKGQTRTEKRIFQIYATPVTYDGCDSRQQPNARKVFEAKWSMSVLRSARKDAGKDARKEREG